MYFHGKLLLISEWKLVLHGEEDGSPIQSDCYNCGIYAILAAKFAAEGIPILATTIRQSSMPLYRKLIAAVHLDRFQLPQRLAPSPSGDRMVLVLEDDKGAGGGGEGEVAVF